MRKKEETSEDKEKTISLNDLPQRGKEERPSPPPLRERNPKPKPKRKEVDLSELRKALEESLEKPAEPEEQNNNNKEGIIRPGDTVKF